MTKNSIKDGFGRLEVISGKDDKKNGNSSNWKVRKNLTGKRFGRLTVLNADVEACKRPVYCVRRATV